MEKAPVIADWPSSVFQRWAYNYCLRNAWRVTAVFGEFEDCMGECALVYVECRLRYGATVNSAKQFMCLYKMMVSCYFATVSTKDRKRREIADRLVQEGAYHQEGDLNVTLSEASLELKQVLQIIIAAPNEVLETLRLDVSANNIKKFWSNVVCYVGIDQIKADGLAAELRGLLT